MTKNTGANGQFPRLPIFKFQIQGCEASHCTKSLGQKRDTRRTTAPFCLLSRFHRGAPHFFVVGAASNF